MELHNPEPDYALGAENAQIETQLRSVLPSEVKHVFHKE